MDLGARRARNTVSLRREHRQPILQAPRHLVHVHRHPPKQLHLQILQLLQKPRVRRDMRARLDYLSERILQRHLSPFHQVRRNDRRGPRDARVAVHEDLALSAFVGLQCGVDDRARRVADLGDARRGGIIEWDSVVGYTVDFFWGPHADTEHVGDPVCGEECFRGRC